MSESTEKKKSSSFLSKLNFFLIVVLGILLLVIDDEQSRRADILYQAITSKYEVDFTVQEVQPIDSSFFLSGASQEVHQTGVRFSGRVINSRSVDHTNVVFELSVNGKSREFTINRISSGNSTGFNVYIPELNIKDARYATLQHVRSQVHFYTQ
ncbi:hypothetical protein [Thioalkalivibrio sulfidiphilus]|uniref:hypothetical protein n=1 Tax=Thioalkalivibrio sulfidiphilus TaxID=1033854 RepID=UPI003B2EE813